MMARPGTLKPEDPLREARRAVYGGEFRSALTYLTELRDGHGSAPEWLLLMAMASWRLGNFAESQRDAREALAGYRGQGDSDGEMRAQNVAAAGHVALGQLLDARRGFTRAYDLARQLDDKLMTARCANNRGSVAYYLGNNADALRYYRLASSLFEQIGSLRGRAEASHNLAVVLREEGELEASREATNRALDAAEQLGDPRALGWSLCGHGETDALLGDLPLAQVEAERAYQLAQESHDRPAEAEALRVLGLIARERGDRERSLEHCRQAIVLAEGLRHQWLIAKTNQEHAESLKAAGRVSDAEAASRAAAEAFRRMGALRRADAVSVAR